MDEFIIPISFVVSTLSYGLIAKWYVMPALRAKSRNEAFLPILFLHSSRYIGLAFLIPGITSEALDLRFANPAAYGDLIASILAIISIIALKYHWSIAIALVWIFNIEGTLDLLNAVFQGLKYVPVSDFGSTFFIPAVVVPALLVSHFMVFMLLIKKPNEHKS